MTRNEVQKLIQKYKNIDVVSFNALSNRTVELKKIQDALNKNAVVIVLK